jgi:hypothetical protein
MNALRAFDRYWFVPAPAARLALLRILIGSFAFAYLVFGFGVLTDVDRFGASHFVPAGVVSLLGRPLPHGVTVLLVASCIGLAIPFVLGFRYRLVAPLFALGFLWVTSYRNSWGMVFHTENLLVLHLFVLAASPAADTLSLDARERPEPPRDGAYGWPLCAMTWIVTIAYVLAGIAKLKLAGPDWAGGELLRAQIAYDNLRKIELGSNYSALGAWLVGYGAPFAVLSWLTLALELGAPIALVGRRAALGWVAAAWLFHVGVLVLMAIPFAYQLSLVAYAPFFPVERWLERPLRRLSQRLPGYITEGRARLRARLRARSQDVGNDTP